MKTAITGTTELTGQEVILVSLENPAKLSARKKTLAFRKTGPDMVNWISKGCSRSIPEVKDINMLAQ